MRRLCLIAAVVGVVGMAGSAWAQQKAPAKSSGRVQPVMKAAAKTPAAPAAAPAEAAKEAPAAAEGSEVKAVVEQYLKLLAASKPYAAVDQHLDVPAFVIRVFGADAAKLDAHGRAYIEQLAGVAIKASSGHMDQLLASSTRGPMSVSEKGDEAAVSFSLTLKKEGGAAGAAGGGDVRKVQLSLHRGEAGWKIVDLGVMTANWRKLYAEEKAAGRSCTDFMEQVAMTMLDAKGGGAERRTMEAMAANLEAQLNTLNNQIELFRARNRGAAPDFAGQGWKQLIEGKYVKAAPVNPVNNKSGVVVGAASADAGWRWDPKTGLTAYGFDWKSGKLTVRPSALPTRTAQERE